MKWYIRTSIDPSNTYVIMLAMYDRRTNSNVPIGYVTNTPGVLQTYFSKEKSYEHEPQLFSNEDAAKSEINVHWIKKEGYNLEYIPDNIVQYSESQKISDISVDDKVTLGKLLSVQPLKLEDWDNKDLKFKIANLNNFL